MFAYELNRLKTQGFASIPFNITFRNFIGTISMYFQGTEVKPSWYISAQPSALTSKKFSGTEANKSLSSPTMVFIFRPKSPSLGKFYGGQCPGVIMLKS